MGVFSIILILIAVFVVAFIAFSLSAVCGGGAGLMLMPILGIILPVTQVPAALSIGTLSSSVSRGVVFYSFIRWDVVRWFVPTALPAVFLGAWLLHYVNPLYLELIMGIFLISNLPSVFRKKDKESTATQARHPLLLVIGFFAGFLSGLTGAVGLLFNHFYLRFGLNKEEIVATRAANELILHLIKLILYISFGLLNMYVLAVGAVIAVAALLSSWIMKWGLKKISDRVFRSVGYASMVVAGMVMLIQSGERLVQQNDAQLTFQPLRGGIESKLKWQNASLAMEFAYDDGFEFEQQIPFNELPDSLQQRVNGIKGDSDKLMVEEVFAFNHHSYEVYFFKDKKLVKKVDW